MFAVVANGFQGICKTQRQLEAVIAIYPYPKFRKCRTKEEARKWIVENKRRFHSLEFQNYGDTANDGYATVRYEITETGIEYQIDTSRLGFIKVQQSNRVLAEAQPGQLRVRCLGIQLNDDLIVHHIIAVRNVLRILGDIIDINICVPDISVYLALTKYRGSNYMIKGVQQDISKRMGAVAVTIEEGGA